MRLVTDPADIEDAYGVASAEALTSFGDGGMYLERAVVGARHVEMQVLADEQRRARARRARLLRPAAPPEADRGGAVAGARRGHPRAHGRRRAAGVHRVRLPQRRHRRVPARPGRLVLLHRDEHPPPGRAPGVRARDRARSRRLAASHRRRRAARRDRASPTSAATRSSSGSTARTPRTTSAPRPGRSPGFGRRSARACGSTRTPTRATACRPSTTRSLAKLIVWGEDRAQALDRSRRALAELEIEGVATTAPLFAEVVKEPVFRSGGYTTAYLDDVRDRLRSLAPEMAA